MPRVEKAVSELSDIGATCLKRALLEGERRWCGNTGEELLQNGVILMNTRELMAMLLDVRTLQCTHVTDEQRKEAKKLLKGEYVDFVLQGLKYEHEKAKELLEAKLRSEALAKEKGPVIEPEVVRVTREVTAAKKLRLESGTAYGDNGGWSASPSPSPDRNMPMSRLDAILYLPAVSEVEKVHPAACVLYACNAHLLKCKCPAYLPSTVMSH